MLVNFKSRLRTLAISLTLSILSVEGRTSSLAHDSVDVAGVKLGMRVAQVKVVHPNVRISEKTGEFRGVRVHYLVGEVMNVGGDSGDTLLLLFGSSVGSADKEPRVLKVQYWASFEGKGKTMLETAVEINDAKEAILGKYGIPDLNKDSNGDTYITYNIRGPGGLKDEIVLQAKITRLIGTTSMSGGLQLELADQAGILRQQVQWVQQDAEAKARKKSKKLRF